MGFDFLKAKERRQFHLHFYMLVLLLQKLTWRSGQADRKNCAMKGKHKVFSD